MLHCFQTPLPTNSMDELPNLSKDPKYKPLVDMYFELISEEAKKNRKPENREQMRAKNDESFKFVEP